MPNQADKSITLIELLIAIVLLSVIILAVNNVSVFSRYQLISTDRRIKLQNDVSRCFEHMTKKLSQAIGNEALASSTGLVAWSGASGSTTYLTIHADSNGNGLCEPLGGVTDQIAGYKLDSTTHKLTYCDNCNDSPCSSCQGTQEELAQDITALSATKNVSGGSNYIDVSLTACWDPAVTSTYNTPDNPCVSMSSSIALPSVATN